MTSLVHLGTCYRPISEHLRLHEKYVANSHFDISATMLSEFTENENLHVQNTPCCEPCVGTHRRLLNVHDVSAFSLHGIHCMTKSTSPQVLCLHCHGSLVWASFCPECKSILQSRRVLPICPSPKEEVAQACHKESFLDIPPPGPSVSGEQCSVATQSVGDLAAVYSDLVGSHDVFLAQISQAVTLLELVETEYGAPNAPLYSLAQALEEHIFKNRESLADSVQFSGEELKFRWSILKQMMESWPMLLQNCSDHALASGLSEHLIKECIELSI